MALLLVAGLVTIAIIIVIVLIVSFCVVIVIVLVVIIIIVVVAVEVVFQNYFNHRYCVIHHDGATYVSSSFHLKL